MRQMRYRGPPITEKVEDRESVYDEQISPLMRQIIAICKANGIPMFASFVFAPERFCTTNLPGPEDDAACARLARCNAEVASSDVSVLAITITTVTEPEK
jgi:hypothetical protein